MAKITVCNICRKELYNLNYGQITHFFETGTRPNCCSTAELCEDCYKKFLEFLKGEK